MSDDFDSQLSRMFSQPPGFADSEAFAARVRSRLDRSWALRRVMIGAGGLAAGLVVAWQFVAGRLERDVVVVSQDATSWLGERYSQAMAGYDQLMSLPAGGETLWFGAGLAAVALTFAATRIVENL